MEEKNKGLKTIITILLIIIAILLAFIVYFVFIKDDKKEETQIPSDTSSYTKINETEGIYYIEKGNSYEIYDNKMIDNNGIWSSSAEDKTPNGNKSTFDYPVININTSDILSINKEIKDYFYKTENQLKNKPNNGCICVKIENEFNCDDYIEALTYKVQEDDKNIAVIIRTLDHTNCADGYSKDKVYTIEKETGKVLTKNDILNHFDYKHDTIYKGLVNTLKSLIDYDFSSTLKSEELVFTIKNNQLIVGGYTIDGYEYFTYDGSTFKVNNDFGRINN